MHSESSFWITPIGGDELVSGDEIVRSLVGKRKLYGFGRHAPGRKGVRPSDWICFYVAGKGIVAYGRVETGPEFRPDILPIYPYVLRMTDVNIMQEPKPLDSKARSRLDAFNSRKEPDWGWFVTATHRVTRNDFCVLTGLSNPVV